MVAPAAVNCTWADQAPEYAEVREMMRQSRAIEPLYRDIADRHLIRFASGIDAEVNIHDWIHLTEKGHRQIADVICNELKRDAASYDVEQALQP